ncbi:MAG: FAD-dependent oxidoreductase [Anaerolineaceae bacterium]|nr:FAD-dependent oxidoreductase [Anaerolineaceae bacterium]
MKKPTILVVDDEPQVLNAITRDLRQMYGKEYRVLKAASGKEALSALREIKVRNESVALFVADQRMPEMNGTEFLNQARLLYPEARKVLLTAYADTEAAITSINTIDLDHYLMKPWDPPEEKLYPVLDDLLSDWWANAAPPYDGIRVAGTLWSASSHKVKDFLARNRIPYQWLDIESDSETRYLVDSLQEDEKKLPVIFFPDGKTLFDPDQQSLAKQVGLKTEASAPYYDLIIIGGGPAGLGAGVYGASEGLKTLVVEKEATGGQAGTSSWIENYLGFPKGISGADLAKRATDQSIRLGCEILTALEVVKVEVEQPYKIITLNDGQELTCKALLIATGVSLRQLDVPGVKRLTGAGVYYGAALTEAANYQDQNVFVVGGANSAGQGAMYFSRFAKKVTMLVRGSDLQKSMSQYLIDQINSQENIEILPHSEVVEVHGKNRLEHITLLNNKSGSKDKVSAAALYIFIGAVAHTDIVDKIITRNPVGFIPTGPDLLLNGKYPKEWNMKRAPFLLETNVPGIFAAGDVRENAIRRVASAVGYGAIAVSLIHQYLKTV